MFRESGGNRGGDRWRWLQLVRGAVPHSREGSLKGVGPDVSKGLMRKVDVIYISIKQCDDRGTNLPLHKSRGTC